MRNGNQEWRDHGAATKIITANGDVWIYKDGYLEEILRDGKNIFLVNSVAFGVDILLDEDVY
jgi:hypothetical protein